LKTIYRFKGGANGQNPLGGLINVDGNLFGTTYFGSNNLGTVFTVNPGSGAMSVLHRFKNPVRDGAYPAAPLIYHAGILYGTTLEGGGENCTLCGTVFSVNAATDAERVVHSFTTAADGAAPAAGLLFRDGYLYGTTGSGGTFDGQCVNVMDQDVGCGVVFKINAKTGTETVLHRFTGTSGTSVIDGTGPASGLVESGGLLFGVAGAGGAAGFGAVYSVDPANGTEKLVYNFQGAPDGAFPVGDLFLHDGALYGSTYEGGAENVGTLFKLNPLTGTETVLYSFTGAPDSELPAGPVTYAGGALYGVAGGGAASSCGTIFKFDVRSGTERLLHTFTCGGRDGTSPDGRLLTLNGLLYGATFGGDYGNGTVFAVRP
jgi:uncharacterized repeat protein (TIGR03803 family)